MKKPISKRSIFLICLLSLCLSACSEQAQPYEDMNTSNLDIQEQGSIQTH